MLAQHTELACHICPEYSIRADLAGSNETQQAPWTTMDHVQYATQRGLLASAKASYGQPCVHGAFALLHLKRAEARARSAG